MTDTNPTTEPVSRHTDGPWEICEPPVGYVQIVGACDGDANDDGSPRYTYTHVCDVIDNQDEQANARLIAAAPALLGALQDLANCCGHDDDKALHAALRNASAAIAKATGEHS